jgi:hypothetical protein
MKILILHSSGQNDNPFVLTLIKQIKSLDVNIDFLLDPSLFWVNKKFDMVFFMWPEAIVNIHDKNEKTYMNIKNRFLQWKQETKIIYLRHNEISHYAKETTTINRLYLLLESEAHYVIHMGEYSKKCCILKGYVNNHIVIPHHIYDNLYSVTNFPTKKEARIKLNLPINKTMVLAFGRFRNKNEQNLLFSIVKAFKKDDIFFYAPMFHLNYSKRTYKYYLQPFTRLRYLFRHKHNLYTYNRFISNEEVPLYFTAADIVFIQRVKILNSGNVPLAFLNKKVVVGPNIGNVGEILYKTGNPSFNPQDTMSVIDAINKAIRQSKEGYGNRNQDYALKYWNVKHVASLYIDLFKKVLSNSCYARKRIILNAW